MWKWSLGEEERKMLQVQPSYVTNKPRLAAWDMTGNMCLRTLIANHAQASHRGPEGLVYERTQCFSSDYVSCNTDVSTNNAVCILASAPSPYLCWTCIASHVRTVHTRIPTPANGRNIPDYQIIADKCDEDTWGMEEWQEGAEERRELTGTSFQYQRVGHCQKKKKGKEIERQGNEDWEDNRSTNTTRGKSSSMWWTKIPVKPEEVESGSSFSW